MYNDITRKSHEKGLITNKCIAMHTKCVTTYTVPLIFITELFVLLLMLGCYINPFCGQYCITLVLHLQHSVLLRPHPSKCHKNKPKGWATGLTSCFGHISCELLLTLCTYAHMHTNKVITFNQLCLDKQVNICSISIKYWHEFETRPVEPSDVPDNTAEGIQCPRMAEQGWQNMNAFVTTSISYQLIGR